MVFQWQCYIKILIFLVSNELSEVGIEAESDFELRETWILILPLSLTTNGFLDKLLNFHFPYQRVMVVVIK